MKDEDKKLKPVVFVKGEYNYYQDNKFQQNILLKALEVTSDPQKLKEMAGLKTVADVYRTLDKLSLRKEYHRALAAHGLSLDVIVGEIKETIGSSWDPKLKLSGLQMLLKSLGLAEYKDSLEQSQQGWEDMLKDKADAELEAKITPEPLKYEVKAPEIPQEAVEAEKKEQEAGQRLYEPRATQ